MHMIDQLGVGGAERCLVELVRHSALAFEEVSICLTRGSSEIAWQLPSGIPVERLERIGRWDWRSAKRLQAALQRRRPNIVHVHGRSSLAFAAASQALGVRTPPLLLHDHDGDGDRRAWVLRAARLRVARYVGSSLELEAKAREAGVPSDRTETIPAGLDLSNPSSVTQAEARRRLGLPVAQRIAVVVAGLRREKGVDTLIEALALEGRPLDTRFFILGGERQAGCVEECRALSARLGVSELVQFMGERLDVGLWLAAADFGVHPARVESGPLALIEEMAAGLPVVCSRAGAAAAEAERSGVEGFVEPDNPFALRRALEAIAALDSANLHARGQFAAAAARASFDIRSRMPRWLDAYRKGIEADR